MHKKTAGFILAQLQTGVATVRQIKIMMAFVRQLLLLNILIIDLRPRAYPRSASEWGRHRASPGSL
jgi:hypothetical protein